MKKHIGVVAAGALAAMGLSAIEFGAAVAQASVRVEATDPPALTKGPIALNGGGDPAHPDGVSRWCISMTRSGPGLQGRGYDYAVNLDGYGSEVDCHNPRVSPELIGSYGFLARAGGQVEMHWARGIHTLDAGIVFSADGLGLKEAHTGWAKPGEEGRGGGELLRKKRTHVSRFGGVA